VGSIEISGQTGRSFIVPIVVVLVAVGAFTGSSQAEPIPIGPINNPCHIVVDGSSFTSLQAAVDVASDNDTVTIGGHCVGTATITKSLRLVGRPGELDGGGAGSVITDISGSLSLTHLRITGGNGVRGGGVDFQSTSGGLEFTNVVITANTASTFGGGIYTANGVSVVNGGTGRCCESTVSGNTAASGGGIYAAAGSVFLERVLMSANSATAGDGGAVFVTSGPMTAYQLDAGANTASGDGGALALSGATVSLHGCLLDGNSAAAGGGVHIVGGALTLTARDGGEGALITGNTASGEGGGILAEGGAELVLARGTNVFANVSHGNGAGISNEESSIQMNMSATISHNTADGLGGGIYNSAGSTVALTQMSLITANSAAEGGGVYNLGHLTGVKGPLKGKNERVRVTGNSPDDVFPSPAAHKKSGH
jgi:predicted outer membrane repeat protein